MTPAWLSLFRRLGSPWPTPAVIEEHGEPKTLPEVQAWRSALRAAATDLGAVASPGSPVSDLPARRESLMALLRALPVQADPKASEDWVSLLRDLPSVLGPQAVDLAFDRIPWAADLPGQSILERGTNACLWHRQAGLLPRVIAHSTPNVRHQGLIYALALKQTEVALRIASEIQGLVDLKAGWTIRLAQVERDFNSGQPSTPAHRDAIWKRFMEGCSEALESALPGSAAQTLLAAMGEPYRNEMPTGWYQARDREADLARHPASTRKPRQRC